MKKIDAVIIAGDILQEMAGLAEREKNRLHVGGQVATVQFFREYFRNNRDMEKTKQALTTRPRIQYNTANGHYLRQVLGAHGFEVEIISLFSMEKDRLVSLLRDKPGAVIISTTFLQSAVHIDAIASFVREHAPDIAIIVGGMQIWKSYRVMELAAKGLIDDDILPAVTRDHYFIDRRTPRPADIFIINQRGERTLVRVMKALAGGESVASFENVACYTGGEWRLNPITEEEYSEVRIDWSAVNRDFFQAEVPVQAGTGCKFRCEFCDFHSLLPVNMRTAESIIAEIASIPPRPDGTRRVFFTDDNLFASPKFSKEFLVGLVKANLNVKWRAFLRTDVVTPEIAGLMRDSGCINTLLGIESGDATILKNMRKASSPEKILHAVECLDAVGIDTQSLIIVGFPGETAQSVANTAAMINAYPTTGNNVHVYYPFIFSVFALAPVASQKERERFGLKGYLGNWSHNTMNSEEAKTLFDDLHAMIKPEISPIYVEGLASVPWDKNKIFTFCRERNKLFLLGKGIKTDKTEGEIWEELRRLFVEQ